MSPISILKYLMRYQGKTGMHNKQPHVTPVSQTSLLQFAISYMDVKRKALKHCSAEAADQRHGSEVGVRPGDRNGRGSA